MSDDSCVITSVSFFIFFKKISNSVMKRKGKKFGCGLSFHRVCISSHKTKVYIFQIKLNYLSM
jgi:hypothetical protein